MFLIFSSKEYNQAFTARINTVKERAKTLVFRNI